MKVVVLLLSVCIGALSCVTVSEDNTPPAITKEMPVQERFDVALKFGGASLKNVKKVTTIEKQWPEMAKVARTYLRNNVRSAEREEIIRAAQIYQSSVPALEPKVLQIFTRHPSQEISVIGWQLAALRPSEELKTFIEEEVSYFVMRGKETRILMPELASAIMENEVHSVYSVLELGLSENKGDDFAKAMICLLYTSDAADDMQCVDLGGRRIIKKRATALAPSHCTTTRTKDTEQRVLVFSSRRRHTRCREVSWARRCV